MRNGPAESPGQAQREMVAVRAAVAELGIDEHAVWAHYLALTGRHDFGELRAALGGRAELDPGEQAKLVAAVNDLRIDRGMGPLRVG